MTQEEKQLLLIDLCARLPYKPHIRFSIVGKDGYEVCEWLPELATAMFLNDDIEIFPYLRPMSSMTEEEEKEYLLLSNHCIFTSVGFAHIDAQILMDWLNAHHFDHRGLISMGLALEATEEMYK